ncbi:hypothetical protein B566_EDAN018134 [Ephemera danica]|nr:hypothetical protein B566_EDAN018134 [Ephemera danica]
MLQNACADVANLDETARGEDDADVLDVEPDVSERRLSVSERAQLFMRLSELNQAQVEDRPRDPVQRRERAKRFSTQPVTSEEVDEARGQLQSQATSGSSEPQVAGSLSSLPAAASSSAAGEICV